MSKNFVYCPGCGEELYIGDPYYKPDTELYCEDCWREYCIHISGRITWEDCNV